MRGKLIVFEILLLVVAVGFFVGMETSEKPTNTTEKRTDTLLFPTLKVSEVEKIKIKKGDQKLVLEKEEQTGKTSALAGKQSGRKQQQQTDSIMSGALSPEVKSSWKLENFHNYPVMKDYVKDRIIIPLRKMKRGQLRSKTREDLDQYNLDDSSAKTITLLNEEGGVVQKVALGKQVKEGFKQTGGIPDIPTSKKSESKEDKKGEENGKKEEDTDTQTRTYYYLANQPNKPFEIRFSPTDFSDVKLDPQKWVQTQVLDFDREKINLIAIRRTVEEQKNADKDEKAESDEVDSSSESDEADQTSAEEDQNDGKKEKKEASVKTVKKQKWFVFYRKKKEQQEETETEQGDADDQKEQDSKNDETSRNQEAEPQENKKDQDEVEYTDWKATVTDSFDPNPFSNSRVFQLGMPGFRKEFPEGKEVKQWKVDDAFDTLSSLKAEKVMEPFAVEGGQRKISKEELVKYGLQDPDVLLLLGRWMPSEQLLSRSVSNYQGKDDFVKKFKNRMRQRGVPDTRIEEGVEALRKDLDKFENYVMFEPLDRFRLGVFKKQLKDQSSKKPGSRKQKQKKNQKELDEVFMSRPYQPSFMKQLSSQMKEKMGYMDTKKQVTRIPLFKLSNWDFKSFGQPESKLIGQEGEGNKPRKKRPAPGPGKQSKREKLKKMLKQRRQQQK